ncbi:MAG: hypothetical protein AB1Z98_22900 [Nannocystaceae bacterium]
MLGAPVLAACSRAPTGDSCIEQTFDRQSTRRFVAGETFYLPRLADSCDGARWALVEQPADATHAVLEGEEGRWRITPTVPGSYRLEVDGVDDPGDRSRVSLEVVPASDRPFYNLNYYGSRSVAVVGEELWTANVYEPTLTRLDGTGATVLGEIAVGPWPVAIAWSEGMDFAVVAQRGNDTLGLVELASGRLIDSIWVGDEPANVVVDASGSTAYVALKSEAAVAVVDLETRTRSARIEVGPDPLAMALASDGTTLWVASHRSGQPSRFPYGDDPIEDERDIAVIDTASAQVRSWWNDVGTTTTGLLLSADESRLYVATLRNDTEASLGATDEPSFMHTVASLDAASGETVVAVDVGRQPSSAGFAVSLHGLALADGALWVAAEASDLTLALDPDSLAELGRFETPGRPRGLVARDGAVFVHGVQGTALTTLSGLGGEPRTTATITDPRPERIAAGNRYFTGAGRDYAANWSCNSCHVDGLTDTLVWNAGPFSSPKVSRPFFWLEGTWQLGWDGYLSSVDNYAFTVNTNVGVRPTTEEHRDLSAYLGSLMAPPAANGFTERDGSLSPAGLRGQQVFAGQAGCTSCHQLPLTTSRALLDEGVTEGVTDIPGLLGSYRNAVWLKLGGATTLASATDQMFEAFGDPGLSAEDRADLDRFMLELTARDFQVLTTEPRVGTAGASADGPVEVVFSHPVWADPSNLERVWLRGPDGSELAVTRALDEDGRHLQLVPSATLPWGAELTIVIEPELESFDERRIWTRDPEAPAASELRFTTGAAPALTIDGSYVWTVDMPTADIEMQAFDLDTTLPAIVSFEVSSTPGGGAAVFDYGADLVLERRGAKDGDTIRTPPLPIPIGPSFADSTGAQGQWVDLDGDGVGDYAEGTLQISGPGFLETGIAWRISRPADAGDCAEGPTGDLEVSVDLSGDVPAFDWGSDPTVGLYIIDPAAAPPAGPSQPVTGGATYWAIQLENFPDGFMGPVTYGVVPPAAVDITMDVGGETDGPAELVSGQCYKATVLTTGFMTGDVTFVMP